MSKKTMCLQTVLGAALVLALSLSASANVTSVYYDLSHPTGNRGPSHTYSGNVTGYDLPIYGFMTNVAQPTTLGNTWTPGGKTANLYGKVTNGDSGETGLGMTQDPLSGQHEIWDFPGQRAQGIDQYGFVVIDTYNLQQNPDLLYFHIQIGSAQQHEWWTVYTSSGLPGSNDGVGTLQQIAGLNSGDQTGFFNVPNWNASSSSRYVWIGAIIDPNHPIDHSNVLLDSEIAFDNNPNGPVPEPGTLGMMGTGLLSVAYSLRKRFMSR